MADAPRRRPVLRGARRVWRAEEVAAGVEADGGAAEGDQPRPLRPLHRSDVEG